MHHDGVEVARGKHKTAAVDNARHQPPSTRTWYAASGPCARSPAIAKTSLEPTWFAEVMAPISHAARITEGPQGDQVGYSILRQLVEDT
jgi:hypothetical protein